MATEARLVIVTTSYPIRGDGSEAAGSFVADLAMALSVHLPIRVVAPGPRADHEVWSERIEVYRYAAPPVPLSTLRPWHPRDMIEIARVMRSAAAVTREASKGAQHILALWGLPCGEWAWRAAREWGISYSVWMLGSDVWTLGRIPILRGKLARVVRESAHAYADGYQLAEDAQKIAGTRVDFLPSTRAIEFVDPPPPRTQHPYRLLFLGRWHPNKGIDLLLDALDLLDDADWSRIEIVEIQGGGPLDALVRERVAALRERGRAVEVGGFLAKPDAEAAIARADWVLIPSRIESIPLVFSDAMKIHRPVVSMPVGDLPRLLATYRCGVLADAVGAVPFAKALRSALCSSTADYSAAVREVALQFSMQSIVAKLLQDCRLT